MAPCILRSEVSLPTGNVASAAARWIAGGARVIATAAMVGHGFYLSIVGVKAALNNYSYGACRQRREKQDLYIYQTPRPGPCPT